MFKGVELQLTATVYITVTLCLKRCSFVHYCHAVSQKVQLSTAVFSSSPKTFTH